MSSGEHDGGSDRTILRPRPGAGRRNEPEAAPAAVPGHAPSQPPTPPPHESRPEALPDTRLDAFAGSDTPLVQAAGTLLMLAARLRHTAHPPALQNLHTELVREVQAFERRAAAAGIALETVSTARYVLCAALDEAVLTTPWGSQSDWSSRSLLVTFHRETWGGEKFFEILRRIRTDPARFRDLLELIYLCLSLGFAGKYAVDPSGPARLETLQHELYEILRQGGEQAREPLSPHWRGVEDRRHAIVRHVPLWVVAAAGALLLTVACTGLRSWLSVQASPTLAELATAGTEEFAAAVPAAAAPVGPRLRELLAEDEAAGRLAVEEEGARTRVTLSASAMFASASERVNPDYYPVLQRIARALEQVPGTVLVVGHSDDLPLRSLRFRDNHELSLARAQSVVAILALALSEPGRIDATGVADTQPRYFPVDTPEYRARNRRVELIHLSASRGDP